MCGLEEEDPEPSIVAAEILPSGTTVIKHLPNFHLAPRIILETVNPNKSGIGEQTPTFVQNDFTP